jgi:SAM-dependent methyltransferase
MVSGDPDLTWLQWVDREFLSKTSRRQGLSLGCNDALFERQMLAAGICRHLDGYDISPVAIAAANEASERDGIDASFYVADVNALSLPPSHYDMVFSVMAMHHFVELESVLAQISRSLAPGGFLVLNEFVGASRFQWTTAQLDLATRILHLLPPSRRRVSDGSIREVLLAPDLTDMLRTDPFEAVRSADIVPLVYRYFDVVAHRDYGGSILHILLHDILHNFDDDAAADREVLQLLCGFEELLIREGVLPSDFTVLVATKRSDAENLGPGLVSHHEATDLPAARSPRMRPASTQDSPTPQHSGSRPGDALLARAATVDDQLKQKEIELEHLRHHVSALENGKVMRLLNALHRTVSVLSRQLDRG